MSNVICHCNASTLPHRHLANGIEDVKPGSATPLATVINQSAPNSGSQRIG